METILEQIQRFIRQRALGERVPRGQVLSQRQAEGGAQTSYQETVGDGVGKMAWAIVGGLTCWNQVFESSRVGTKEQAKGLSKRICF